MSASGATGTSAKQRLRAQLLAGRRARSHDEVAGARSAVGRHVLEHVDGIDCVAGYLPYPSEPGSTELLAALRARGIRVLVPMTLADRDLEWAPWDTDGPGTSLGREAIGAAGLVLVPALAVAADGTRLGRGGGSYDRALLRRGSEAVVAALVYDDELLAQLPRDPWDVPVAAVVTPSGWQARGRNTEVAPHC